MRTMLDEGLPALAQAKAEGRIGAYGIGVNDVDICSTTLRHADLDLILLAGRYTLADQSALPQLLPECLRRDVSVVLGGPFNSGILATGARPADGSPPSFDYAPAAPAIVARVAAIEALCAQFDVPLKAAALQFPRAHPAIVNVLCGMRSIAEFDENHAAVRLPIPASFWQTLRAQGLVDDAAPLPDDDCMTVSRLRSTTVDAHQHLWSLAGATMAGSRHRLRRSIATTASATSPRSAPATASLRPCWYRLPPPSRKRDFCWSLQRKAGAWCRRWSVGPTSRPATR